MWRVLNRRLSFTTSLITSLTSSILLSTLYSIRLSKFSKDFLSSSRVFSDLRKGHEKDMCTWTAHNKQIMCSISAGDKVIGTIYKGVPCSKISAAAWNFSAIFHIKIEQGLFFIKESRMSSTGKHSELYIFYQKQRISSLRDELTPLVTFENTTRRLENAHDLALETEHLVY